MADLQKILDKFSELGIENKGLTPDDPMQQRKSLKEQNSSNSIDPTAHARMVAESIKGAHIPGVSDVSSNDMAALAGVTSPGSATPTPAVQSNMTVAPTETYSDKWAEVDARLSSIETKINSIFESIQKIAVNEISDADYRAKQKALQDLQADPHTSKDPELQAEIQRRKEKLEKERKETTKESLEKGFASFLKELEG